MTKAQVSLTPTESKKLIAKAVVRMPLVKEALLEGIVACHPSSSTIFVMEEIIGHRPGTTVWACGIVAPKGTCIERASYNYAFEHNVKAASLSGPEEFPHTWVLRKGRFSSGERLGSILEEMGPRDVYIKGVNALDAEGWVGVLFGNPSRVRGGTIAKVLAAQKKKKFALIFPAGLEKLIPISVRVAAREAQRQQYCYSTGIGCGLLPCKGTNVTEIEAINILTGAEAIPISAGGLGGAEGSVTLVVKGEQAQVEKAIEYVEQCKGAELPVVRMPECEKCFNLICGLAGKKKAWIKDSGAS